MRVYNYIYQMEGVEIARESVKEDGGFKIKLSFERDLYKDFKGNYHIEYEYPLTAVVFECKMVKMLGNDIYYNVTKTLRNGWG